MRLPLKRSQVEVSRYRGFGDAPHDASFGPPDLLQICCGKPGECRPTPTRPTSVATTGAHHRRRQLAGRSADDRLTEHREPHIGIGRVNADKFAPPRGLEQWALFTAVTRSASN